MHSPIEFEIEKRCLMCNHDQLGQTERCSDQEPGVRCSRAANCPDSVAVPNRAGQESSLTEQRTALPFGFGTIITGSHRIPTPR